MIVSIPVIRKAACITLAALACSFLARAERLPVRTYTVADGLLRDSVTRVRQDSRGFVWFCTPDGISRFDGYGFINFRPEDGLPERHVNDFLETRSGIYLIATDAGLARLEPRGIRGSAENPLFTVSVPDDPAARVINTLYEGSDGTVWVGTDAGLFLLNDKFELENVLLDASRHPPPVYTLFQDRNGALWIGSADKLFRRLVLGGTETYTSKNGLPTGMVNVIFQDSNGEIWIGMRPGDVGGLIRVVTDPSPDRSLVERYYRSSDGLLSPWITGLYQTDDGRFWVGTTTGLCLWRGDGIGSVCQDYIPKNELCGYGVTNMIEDKDGNLWFGGVCGAKKLIKYGFTTFDQEDGFKTPVVNSIFENRAGELFVSLNSRERYLSRLDGNKFTHLRRNLTTKGEWAGSGWMHTVWQDSSGAWWVPSGDGVYRSPPNTDFEKLSEAVLSKVDTGAKPGEVYRVFEDSRSDVWIATQGGILRWERKQNVWHDHTLEIGLSRASQATAFAEDARGALWIATGSDIKNDSVLIRYYDGKFKVFTNADGAPPGWTRDLLVDGQNRLWLANTVIGLLRLDDTASDGLNFVHYTTADGLSSNGVYCVTDDKFGRIYVGSGRGLDRLYPETGRVENFKQSDSLPGTDIQVAYRDRSDTLWFETNFGLARFVPEPERTRTPPTVLITGLRTAGVVQPVSILGERSVDDLDLRSDQSNVSIEFLGLGATLGEQLGYEYRVTGDNWIPANERIVNFANLSPGDYLFEVRAVSADKLYSTPATVGFNIAAPLWQRWWFILLVSFAAAGVVYLFYRNRLQRLLELERVRTRIATDLHDDIGANLTRISILSEVAKQKASNGNGQMLSSIAEIARESVASMNDIVWAVSPKHDSVSDLITRMRRHAEEVFTVRDIALSFEVPETDAGLRLGVGVRRDLLLIFKEAVNNAARHSGCSEVHIEITVGRTEFSLQMSDNGRSFDLADIDGDGHGLESMQRRAKVFDGALSIESEPGKGTSIRLTVPLSRVEKS